MHTATPHASTESTKSAEVSSSEFTGLLKAGYQQDIAKREKILTKFGYEYDRELSSAKTTVAKNTQTGKAFVVYKGTDPTSLHDVWTDLHILAGTKPGRLSRVKEARKTYKAVRSKYGAGNVTTGGHSLGGYLAQHSKADKVMTFNKLSIGDEKSSMAKHQIDYRNRGDVASMMRDTEGQKKHRSIEVEGGKWYKPVSTHTQFRYLKVADATGTYRNKKDKAERSTSSIFHTLRAPLVAFNKTLSAVTLNHPLRAIQRERKSRKRQSKGV